MEHKLASILYLKNTTNLSKFWMMNSPRKQTYYTECFNNFTSSSSVSGSSGWKLSNEPRSCSCWKEENTLIFWKSLVWVLVLHGSILFPLPWDLVSMTVFLSFVHIRNFSSTAGMNKEQSFKKFSHCDLLFTWKNFYLPQTNLRVCCSWFSRV